MVYMGFKHAEEALSLPENCSHCFALPKKLLHCRLKVASTQSADDQYDSDVRAGESVASLGASQGMPALSWADQSDEGLLEEILPGISSLEYEPHGSGEDKDPALLEGSDDEDTIPSTQVPLVSGSAAYMTANS